MKSVVRQSIELFEVLSNDVIQCLKKLQTEDSQFWRRVFVRAVIALIEGQNYQLKLITLEACKHKQVSFSNADLALLKDEKFVSLKDNLKFSFKTFALAFDLDYKLAIGVGDRWKSFITAIEIRNRLTHPKTVDQVLVTDKDLEEVKKAHDWFAQSITDLIGSYVLSLENTNKSGVKPHVDI